MESRIELIFQHLRSPNAQQRLTAALDLRHYLSSAILEISDASADDDITRRLFQLTHSQHTYEAFGGLEAIGQIIDIPQSDSKRNLFRFWNYVKHLLPNRDESLMLAASSTLGRIAKVGGAVFGEAFMDKEVSTALEMLQQESAQYAGLLILKELACNGPTYFHVHLDAVFDSMLVDLSDQRVTIRESASDLLAACMDIAKERQIRDRYLSVIFRSAHQGIEDSRTEIIHGSLLMYRELLLHGGLPAGEGFLDDAERILRLKSHRDQTIRKMVMTLIPSLAAYDTQIFVEHFLNRCMAHLLTAVENPKEQTTAILAIGHTATVVEGHMTPFLKSIMTHVKSGLQGRGMLFLQEPIFQCVGMLAAAVGPSLANLVYDQLDIMLSCGLSEPLRQTLASITLHIPSLSDIVQDRLLNMLSNILSSTPYKSLGCPPTGPPKISINCSIRSFQVPISEQDLMTVTLALKTLGSFDFTGHALADFARVNALPYLDDDHSEIRRAAAVTCCRLLTDDPICYQTSSCSIEVISEVLNKLVIVGIADPEPHVRHTVLSSLDAKLDKHLAQAENVRSLFIALNDEDFENRVVSINLIGRLAKNNPSYVLPLLRKALIQLLTELEYSTISYNREECTRILSLLINSMQRLIKPYAVHMLRVLLKKANDINPTVASNVLMCIGELACASGEDSTPHIPQIMQVIISCLLDSSIVKRDVALHTLSQVCSNTGYVIEPLVDHPQLIDILGRIFATESSKRVRREVLKVLGIMGAMDPYQRINKVNGDVGEAVPTVASQVDNQDYGLAASDDYFQSIAFTVLLDFLKDPSLNAYHPAAVEAIMSVFKTRGPKCFNFLSKIIPAFTSVSRVANEHCGFYLEQLSILVGIVERHVRNFMPDILSLITELWQEATLQLPLVSLIEALGKTLDAEFRPFLPTLLPLILQPFDKEIARAKGTTIQIKIFDAFSSFGANIEEYLQLVLPIVIKSYENVERPLLLRKRAIQTIGQFSRHVNLSSQASRIIHPLVRILDTSEDDLRMASMDALCSLVLQLGSDFVIFAPSITKAIKKNPISHSNYEHLLAKLLNGEQLPRETSLDILKNKQDTQLLAPSEAPRLVVNQQHLKQACNVLHVTTREDWLEWMHRFTVELLKESPSHALRACATLVSVYAPLAKELFNAAFLSCWMDLYEQYQENLLGSIEYAMASATAPSELVYRFLILEEFMERHGKRLPINLTILGETAMKCMAYAKALHYKELEFFCESSPGVIESLIQINTRLQQHDAAWGTLLIARDKYDITKHEEWYDRLGRWEEALVAYERKKKIDPGNQEFQIGRMKCLHALSEWEDLAAQVKETWPIIDDEYRQEVAPIAAAAAWSLRQWDQMEVFTANMNVESLDHTFNRAILLVNQNQFPKALAHIAKARDLMGSDLNSFSGENYEHSYNAMVRLQMLSELEEIIFYKQNADRPEYQKLMRKTWMKRLRGCQADLEVWQRIISVRSLVLDPRTDPIMWIKFANLCRKSGQMELAQKTIKLLLPPRVDVNANVPPNVVYAELKIMWAVGAKEESLHHLRQLVERILLNLSSDVGDESVSQTKLLARCYFKIGHWQLDLANGWGMENIDHILRSYSLSTQLDPSWYNACHAWALANSKVVDYIDTQAQTRPLEDAGRILVHVVQAIISFFRSISLRPEGSLQDTLRILNLWFKYGSVDDVGDAMRDSFSTVNIETWLEVIPQIIARIQTSNSKVRRDINNLLVNIGRHHPQALIYPLTVASKSTSTSRRNAALSIMDRMREHSPTIVSQGLLVIRELVRVAILWHELWYEGLEEASRQFYFENNPDAMIATLERLYDMMESGPTTAHEVSFVQIYGRELRKAREAIRRWRTHGDMRELNEAWSVYGEVFKKLQVQQDQLKTIDLQYVSPSLQTANNLDLAVPGTYQNGRPAVQIVKFSPKLSIIESKQHPRRLSLKGSDGKDYQYLLKGHEDLRQDERVMQLFGLVNTLLSVDRDSFKRRLHIRHYPVIPLASNAGLIGWMHGTDTFHSLIRDYRQSRRVLLDIEYRLMAQMAPDYENLTQLQQIEVFEYGLQKTTGQDLYRILWLKSTNSEHWVNRRTTYTRSLAVTSMVGHILGLGDRHPANFLLERSTGEVIHIDFGDCFEVAMKRDKYPEKVPFRLTRMLVHAMEVSGIEGSFRKTCEVSMKVIRDNKESLMAVLEAFVYDPLISWRLVQTEVARRASDKELLVGSSRSTVHLELDTPPRRLQANEHVIFGGAEDPGAQEVLNERALSVFNRVQHKLNGRDFDPEVSLNVEVQVDRLIKQATAVENLCGAFKGWCSFW